MCIPDNLEDHAWNFRAWHLGTQSQHLISTATHGIPSTFFRGCGGSTTKHMLLGSSMIFLIFAALPYFFALRLTICSCYHTEVIVYILHWHSSYRLEICKRFLRMSENNGIPCGKSSPNGELFHIFLYVYKTPVCII